MVGVQPLTEATVRSPLIRPCNCQRRQSGSTDAVINRLRQFSAAASVNFGSLYVISECKTLSIEAYLFGSFALRLAQKMLAGSSHTFNK